MGDPKKLRRKYSRPTHLWKRDRIAEEKELSTRYGLKNMREIWRIKSKLSGFRKEARKLLAIAGKEKEVEELLSGIRKIGIDVKTLEDVLALKMEDLLDRRLQSIVHKRGLVTTVKQARQNIIHGHVLVKDRVINVPGYLVLKEEEDSIKLHDLVINVEEGKK